MFPANSLLQAARHRMPDALTGSSDFPCLPQTHAE
jgi:hypothetical protein